MSPSANTLHLGAGGFPVALELTSQEGSDNHSPGIHPWVHGLVPYVHVPFSVRSPPDGRGSHREGWQRGRRLFEVPGMNPWAMIVSLFGLMLPNSVASDRFLHPACPRRSNAPGA